MVIYGGCAVGRNRLYWGRGACLFSKMALDSGRSVFNENEVKVFCC
jgi:hypothetical protein